ncbi:MAG: response regulator [Bacteroidetes bacterium]|nr:response regulator [Bacteroidota bacterium]MBU1578593.1 response regulator [Bacteroidota bacterium]MBU2558143.1 response regulator [Bacteroidota bacterium]
MNALIDLEDGYILAAEDSMVQSKKLQYFFDEHQLKHIICKNGEEAFNQALKEKPILIISDIVMPVMDGYTFCSKIKSKPDLKDIPVILLTSLSDPLDIIKGLQAGADNFITKPYESNYLISRIKYLLANRFLHKHGSANMSMDIMFQNQRFQINSDKKQILDLLLSVYEAAISRNEKLLEVQKELQKANDNLIAANEELEAFAHTVSHDLKTPLNGIIGFSDLLKMEYGDKMDEDAQEYIDWIIKSSNNMSHLIEDLLQFSRSGRAEINPEEINLSVMTREIISELRSSAFTSDYKVEIEEDVIVNADPKMMRVVLQNLLGNALKYSQKAKSPEITFGTREYHGHHVIYVKDNGAGFDMAKADTLFQPFIRLHSNSEFQGTGVGLSTVKRIIERHDGEIWFESVPGKGAVFFFRLD